VTRAMTPAERALALADAAPGLAEELLERLRAAGSDWPQRALSARMLVPTALREQGAADDIVAAVLSSFDALVARELRAADRGAMVGLYFAIAEAVDMDLTPAEIWALFDRAYADTIAARARARGA
jgi:hypothetical protein